MKKILLGLTLALMSSAAFAADPAPLAPTPIPVPAAAPTPVLETAVMPIWTGFYVSGNVGYGVGHSTVQTDGTTAVVSPKTHGPMLGGTIGYQQQMNNIVAGVETSLFWADLYGSTSCAAPLVGYACKTSSHIFGDISGKIGYSYDKWLGYGTVGFAYDNQQLFTTATGDFSKVNRTLPGWTVGIGADYAVTRNIYLGGEWKHMDFGTAHLTNTIGGVATSSKVGFHDDLFLAKVGYKF